MGVSAARWWCCKMFDPTQTTEFQAALNGCRLTEPAVARHLLVSVPTIQRWKSGGSQPHPIAMPAIMAALKDLGAVGAGKV